MTGFKGPRMARLAMVGFMALTATSAVTVAHAEEQGEFVKSVLGKIGLIPEDKDPIEYRERAPLVLPKGNGLTALPPPVQGNYGERKVTNWPHDPDAAAAKERKAAEARPRTQTDEWLANRGDARVPAEAMRKTRSAGRDPNDRTPVNAADPNMMPGGWIPPDKLKKMGRNTPEETKPGAEPSRRALTDPPTGYRKSTGGPVKPTFEARETEDPASPYYLQHQKEKQAQEKY